MRAELPFGTSLKIIMKDKADGDEGWMFSSSSKMGRAIDGYNTSSDSQQFTAYGQIICDVKLYFYGHGSADIEIYENKSVTPIRIKKIYW